MSLKSRIDSMVVAFNGLMGVVDGKLRNKPDKTDVYSRQYLDDPSNTLQSNSSTASRLKISREIELAGDAVGSVGFDGSGSVVLQVSIPALSDKADAENVLTPAEIDLRIQQVIGSAPAALDTLKEIATALGDDPNFAATITAGLSKKANAADVFSTSDADKRFLMKQERAADSVLFGGNSLSHFATASALDSLESGVIDGFSQLANTFDAAAEKIKNGA